MTVTVEPRGLEWINNLNVSTFGSLVTNLCWFLGSTALTVVACILLLREDYYLANGTLVIVEMQRQLGLTLAGFLLGAWTGKTVAGVVNSNNKRKTHPAYADVVEAKERGKAGARVDAALAAAVVTRDRPAVRVEPQSPTQEVTVNVGAEGEPNGELRRGE